MKTAIPPLATSILEARTDRRDAILMAMGTLVENLRDDAYLRGLYNKPESAILYRRFQRRELARMAGYSKLSRRLAKII